MTSGNVTLPMECVRAPSAMVSGLWQLCSVRDLNERVASSPSAGSTPMVLQSGERVCAAIAHPDSSPPPPQQTSR